MLYDFPFAADYSPYGKSDSVPSCLYDIHEYLQYKRQRKSSAEPLEPSKRSFLSSLLTVILEKLKWEEDADPEDMDEDDKAAFEELRKVNGLRKKNRHNADCCYTGTQNVHGLYVDD